MDGVGARAWRHGAQFSLFANGSCDLVLGDVVEHVCDFDDAVAVWHCFLCAADQRNAVIDDEVLESKCREGKELPKFFTAGVSVKVHALSKNVFIAVVARSVIVGGGCGNLGLLEAGWSTACVVAVSVNAALCLLVFFEETALDDVGE